MSPVCDRATPTTTPTEVDTAQSSQIPPVGPHPNIDTLLLGALMWSKPRTAAEVLALVLDDDMSTPARSTVLAAVRRLVNADTPPGPQLVLDQLCRGGRLDRAAAKELQDAATSGAQPAATSAYAAGVVAESLRRRIESVGVALSAAARDAAEPDLAPLVARAADSVADCARRLDALRGESL